MANPRKGHCTCAIEWEIALSPAGYMVVVSSPFVDRDPRLIELCLNRCMEGAGLKPALEHDLRLLLSSGIYTCFCDPEISLFLS